MRQSTNTHFHKLSHANETSTLASRSILQAMATGGVVPQLRVSHVVRPRPSGRYVYESSSEEEEDVLLQHSMRLDAQESDDDDSDEEWDPSDRVSQRDIARIRLANELDPWERWENACHSRAWRPVHRGRSVLPSPASASSTPKPSSHNNDPSIDEVENILAQFQIQQSEVEKKEREGFQKRNTSLWEGIEAAIRQAEQRTADEAQRLVEARRKQEEAEAKARRAREEELKRIDAEKQAARAKQLEEEAKARERAQQDENERRANVFRGGSHMWPSAKTEYAHWQERMKYVKEDVLPSIAQRADWRKQCFTAKRAITPKVGQLTNSQTEIMRITVAISDILQQARDVPDHDAATRLYYWMLNHLSKCLIRQAEQEVAARQETAFPLARLIMGLLLRGHAALGDVFMARLVKKCPWVLAYIPERASQDEAVYRRRIGFKTPDETSQAYASRIVGIMALYFACIQTSLESVMASAALPTSTQLSDAAKHIPVELRPGRLWTWQSRSLTPPLVEQGLIVSLWCTFLEIAGPVSLQRYKRQGTKILSLLLEHGIYKKRLGSKEDNEVQHAAFIRLTLILETWKMKQTLVEHVSPGRDMDP